LREFNVRRLRLRSNRSESSFVPNNFESWIARRYSCGCVASAWIKFRSLRISHWSKREWGHFEWRWKLIY
jgi:hypothetical protein